MNILVIGATGRTGSWVDKDGLARKHVVTAVVRNGDAVAIPETRIIVGDPTNPDDVASAVAGQEVVISCLGRRAASDRDVLQNAAFATVGAMEWSAAIAAWRV